MGITVLLVALLVALFVWHQRCGAVSKKDPKDPKIQKIHERGADLFKLKDLRLSSKRLYSSNRGKALKEQVLTV